MWLRGNASGDSGYDSSRVVDEATVDRKDNYWQNLTGVKTSTPFSIKGFLPESKIMIDYMKQEQYSRDQYPEIYSRNSIFENSELSPSKRDDGIRPTIKRKASSYQSSPVSLSAIAQNQSFSRESLNSSPPFCRDNQSTSSGINQAPGFSFTPSNNMKPSPENNEEYMQTSSDSVPIIKEEVDPDVSRPTTPVLDWSLTRRNSISVLNQYYQNQSQMGPGLSNPNSIEELSALNASLGIVDIKRTNFRSEVEDLQLRQLRLIPGMPNLPLNQTPSSPGFQFPVRPRPIISAPPQAWSMFFPAIASTLSPFMQDARFQRFPNLMDNPLFFPYDSSSSGPNSRNFSLF